MSKLRRVTIMLDTDIEKKLREKQAKQIRATGTSCSFSNIINLELRKSK